jgi:hypothetical protein
VYRAPVKTWHRSTELHSRVVAIIALRFSFSFSVSVTGVPLSDVRQARPLRLLKITLEAQPAGNRAVLAMQLQVNINVHRAQLPLLARRVQT